MSTLNGCVRRIVVLLLCGFALGGGAPARADFDHEAFDRLLRRFVRKGKVDYVGIKRQGRAQINAYVEAIGAASLDGLTRHQRLAFYLNAYNALVIKAVVDRYPLPSVIWWTRG